MKGAYWTTTAWRLAFWNGDYGQYLSVAETLLKPSNYLQLFDLACFPAR